MVAILAQRHFGIEKRESAMHMEWIPISIPDL
jgi:hypothetical protein